MMICFFHKKKIINFSSSTLRSRAYFLRTPKHIQRQLLKTALQIRMFGNAHTSPFPELFRVPNFRHSFIGPRSTYGAAEMTEIGNEAVTPDSVPNGGFCR